MIFEKFFLQLVLFAETLRINIFHFLRLLQSTGWKRIKLY